DVQVVAEKPFANRNHYLTAGRKAGNCGVFQGITYKNLYDGIDLHYYSEAGFIKYDLIIHPGADPGKFVLRYDGQSQLLLNKGQMHVQTTVGEVRELEPKSFQAT